MTKNERHLIETLEQTRKVLVEVMGAYEAEHSFDHTDDYVIDADCPRCKAHAERIARWRAEAGLSGPVEKWWGR